MNYENALRQIKRKKFSRGRYSRDEDEFIPSNFYSLALYADHAPMKNESKKLRNIMATTSLSKDEVLSVKKYRKELSEAQKRKGTLTNNQRVFIRICKRFMEETNTSIFNKDFNSKFLKYVDETTAKSFFYTSRLIQGINIISFGDFSNTYLRLIKIRKNKATL